MFSPLAPSVCCVVPFMFSHMLLPLVTSPDILPPLSSPVPCHIISVCVFSLCVPFMPCLVIVFVCLVSVLSMLFLNGMCPLDFDFCFLMFDLNFDLFFFSLYFVLPLSCYFTLLFWLLLCFLSPLCLPWVFCIRLLLN